MAHFHYVMVGGMVSAFFARLHYWGPKIFGRMYPEMWGRAGAIIIFIGFNLTFFPQFLLGYLGMPRRYHSYPPEFQVLNVLSSAGATILAVGYLLPFGYLTWSGVIVLALVGTAADIFAAAYFARQNKMGLVLGICIGSAIQVALLVAPLLVIISSFMGRPMTLVFSDPLELFLDGEVSAGEKGSGSLRGRVHSQSREPAEAISRYQGDRPAIDGHERA